MNSFGQLLKVPESKEALRIFDTIHRIVNAKFIDEEDGKTVVELLLELVNEHNYKGALLNLGALYTFGFPPAITVDIKQGFTYYTQCMLSPDITDIVAEKALEEIALLFSGHPEIFQEHFKPIALQILDNPKLPATVKAYIQYALVAKPKNNEEKTNNQINQTVSKDSSSDFVHVSSVDEDDAEEEVVEEMCEEQKAAEALKEEGNELYKQGMLPGNSIGRKLLLEAAEKYEEACEVYRDVVYISNAAQAYCKAEQWRRGKERAEQGLKELLKKSNSTSLSNNKKNNKSKTDSIERKLHCRLALCLAKMRKFAEAATAINDGLLKCGIKDGGLKKELWQIAEQIPRDKLPDNFEWAVTNPALEKQKPEYIDMEKRICGKWGYGPTSEQSFNIRLMPWGALIYTEKDVKVELMQDRLLSWHGEFSLIPGMMLELGYEPAADELKVSFIPPPADQLDPKEAEKFKGPQRFIAVRLEKSADYVFGDSTASEGDGASNTGTSASETSNNSLNEKTHLNTADNTSTAASSNEGVDCLTSRVGNKDTNNTTEAQKMIKVSNCSLCPALNGVYTIIESEIRNDKPCYKSKEEGKNIYLWFRGGQWGFTKCLDNSAFKAPFLARCGNSSSSSKSPLEAARRPMWMVNTGNKNEAPDKMIKLETTSEEANNETESKTGRDKNTDSNGTKNSIKKLNTQSENIVDDIPSTTASSSSTDNSSKKQDRTFPIKNVAKLGLY